MVYTALIDLLSSEDELAAVLAHETAHVLARHHVRVEFEFVEYVIRYLP